MLAWRTLRSWQSWSSVGRWTILGTLGCVVVAVAFNALMFADMGPEAQRRSLISAVLLPIVMGVPLFFFFSMRVRGLARTNFRLGQVARTDSLTACLNRGAFTAKVSALLTQQQARAAGALLMIDADNFKSINDMFGHEAGDEALTIIARSIRAVLRGCDLVGRMGGEEFGVFLPGADEQATTAIAERIRRSVDQAEFMPGGIQRPLSVSIGGAVFIGKTSFSELFRIADQRLYGAKQAGRNRAAIVHTCDYPFTQLRRSA
jgi:diguanylate cyclase